MMIHKSAKPPALPDSYPISILSCLGKRLAHRRLLEANEEPTSP